MTEPSLETLQNCISQHNPFTFLKTYLILIKEGHTLSLPTNIELDLLQEEWKEVLPKTCIAPESFYTELSHIWLNLITRIPKESPYKNTITELIEILQGTHTSSNPTSADLYQGGLGAQTSKAYKTLIEFTTKNPSQQKLEKDLHTYIKKENAKAFLQTYLWLSALNKTYTLSHSRQRKNNEDFWKQKLNTTYNCKSESFITDIINLYINLAHTIGIPITQELVEQCYIKLSEL